MRNKNLIRIEIRKHEAIFIAFLIFLGLIYVSEFYLDSGSCSKKNPDIDCTQRGLIDISQLYFNNYTQTTGFGLHYNGITPVPEFRGTGSNYYGGYIHAVCDLGNSTCEWHLDKYPALGDFPFGFVLHEADTLNLYVGFFTEDVWQGILWLGIISAVYGFLRAIEYAYEKLR